MAELQGHITPDDPAEKSFRKKHLWHSFTTAAYGALSIASFMGALQTLASGLINAATTASAGTATAGTAAAGAASVFAPLPMLVIGGLLAVGLVTSYMSQREATELQIAKDEHLACQNAKQMQPGLGKAPMVEYEQNCRSDGKKWAQVTQATAQAQHLRG